MTDTQPGIRNQRVVGSSWALARLLTLTALKQLGFRTNGTLRVFAWPGTLHF